MCIRDRLYTVAVNGQTGKVVGNVPSNRFKVGASIAILMTVMVVLCTYAVSYTHLKADVCVWL